ncbi:CopY/TcrY family copper transport repressor [Lacticaseibacillus yichunensis]|uniref:CopY/TcrY family copper transport repressor n=1 Tax=Lacticaseibacillus yichunensis TaxID=2486015 RepID=A0ABW4CPJ7_9LACO|nr:CopY/TcrY family copper transport repressor [Lacticaseibacillus yichunensis]
MNDTNTIEEITPAEWEVMRIIWTLGQASAHQVIDLLQQKRDWSDSTIKTLLGRLVKKGLLETSKDGRSFIYKPLISETAAMNGTASQLFSHLCAMKRGKTLVELIETLPLSRGDIETLQAALAKKLPDAPEMVDCDCLPGGMQETDCNCKEDHHD